MGVFVPPLNTATDANSIDLDDNLLILVIVFDVRSSFIIEGGREVVCVGVVLPSRLRRDAVVLGIKIAVSGPAAALPCAS